MSALSKQQGVTRVTVDITANNRSELGRLKKVLTRQKVMEWIDCVLHRQWVRLNELSDGVTREFGLRLTISTSYPDASRRIEHRREPTSVEVRLGRVPVPARQITETIEFEVDWSAWGADRAPDAGVQS